MRASQNRHGHFAALEDSVPSKSNRLEGYSKDKNVENAEVVKKASKADEIIQADKADEELVTKFLQKLSLQM